MGDGGKRHKNGGRPGGHPPLLLRESFNVRGSGGGGGIRTRDLWVMSPTSCRCSTPRHPARACSKLTLVQGSGAPATASPPTGLPLQYSPALRRVTTGFGMGPGGATALSATGAPDPPTRWSSHACSGPTHALAQITLHTHSADPSRLGNGARYRSQKSLPSFMRTGQLRSVTSRPPPAAQPGSLPGNLPLSSGDPRLGR